MFRKYVYGKIQKFVLIFVAFRSGMTPLLKYVTSVSKYL